MKSVAAEFNISVTCFLVPVTLPSEQSEGSPMAAAAVPRFHLRWFTTVDEVNLCGHATLASAHFLFTSSFKKYNEVEFITKSGILSAKKVYGLEHMNSSKTTATVNGEQFSIELNFPLISVVECDDTDIPLISGTLNGALVVDVKKTAGDDLIVVLASGKDVADIKPQFEELKRCPRRGVIITGPAPEGSGFDFFTRFFCPKLGVNEDPVCGSAHCSLAPYWARKLGKNNLVAYMASPRGGVLDLVLEEEKQRLRIRGQAVTVMTGTLLC
ncbi:unnamed protein product [Spirodela intermedia]|uniref:Uncharacterized protein n=1 Tax=Spirodela intermedia TaxID=51605 RepID=A0A7I8L7F2_SPIIN|nr:unnamed protein product [Spirodela intermedia]